MIVGAAAGAEGKAIHAVPGDVGGHVHGSPCTGGDGSGGAKPYSAGYSLALHRNHAVPVSQRPTPSEERFEMWAWEHGGILPY